MRIDEIQILLDQGRLALNQGRFDEAGELIDRVLAESEANEQALNLKGLLLFKQERFDEAISLFQRLVDKYPNEPTLLMNLGLAYLKSEKFEMAITELEKARSFSPNNPKIHNYLGLAYSGVGRLQKAQEHFREGGSKKMADQMLQMMRAKSGEDDTPEIEVEVAGSSTPPAKGEDTLDKSFNMTFAGGPTGVPAPNKPLAAAPAQPEAHTAISPPPQTTRAPAQPQSSPAPPVATAPRTGAALPEQVSAPDTAPTELLSGAVSILKDRYGVVLDTLEAGAGLSELAKILEIKRDPHSRLQQVRPNLLRVTIDQATSALARMGGVLAIEGSIRAEPRKKRYKGKDINSVFGGEAWPVFELIGAGAAYLHPHEKRTLFPVRLDGELIYIVEDAFFAMAGDWRWENGRLPGQQGNDLHLVQIRGKGELALTVREGRRLAAMRVSGNKITLPGSNLAGWFGNVVPVLVDMPLPRQKTVEAAVQFQGDGTILVQIPAAV